VVRRLNKALKIFMKYMFPFVPFLLGYIGYALDGMPTSNALYGSLILYKGLSVQNAPNIWIEIARWLAIIVTLSMIVRCVTFFYNNIIWVMECLHSDSVAVYSNKKIKFSKHTHAIYPDVVKPLAKSHIILKDTDADSFKFYAENKEILKGKKVFVGLSEIDFGLVSENHSVFYFDINGTIARTLWNEIGIYRNEQDELSIAIYGDDSLAESVLVVSLLQNLFSVSQKITYKIIGANPFVLKHPDFSTMNGDKIELYENKEKGYEVVRDADIVVITDKLSVEKLQILIANCNKADRVFYYSRHAGDFVDCVSLPKLEPFGRDEDIYTDENIRQDATITKAKEINRIFCEKYGGESDWSKLSGFVRWSNISAADYMEVLKDIIAKRLKVTELSSQQLEELSELEHIRWSRFHLVNYWKYGVPENGATKDSSKRIHVCLVDYSELSETEKQKDRDHILDVLENNNH